MENNQPIIIKRVRKVIGGHHGGAWKIAFADFAIAMMAFFLVMWLMSTATPEQKRAISGYFQDPIGFNEAASPHAIDLGGTPVLAPDKTLNPVMEKSQAPEAKSSLDSQTVEELAEQVERERLDLVLREIQHKIDENPLLERYKDQILMQVTDGGLRIQIVDAENRPMFDLGSASLQTHFEDILLAMSDSIRAVPNKISISGHTDAKPYASLKGDFGNWELSASRANAARRVLIAGGYPDEQVARVVGYASSSLYDVDDPLNPVNRRIEITVLTRKAAKAIEQEQGREQVPEPAQAPEAAPQAEPVQPRQVRERMNLFNERLNQLN